MNTFGCWQVVQNKRGNERREREIDGQRSVYIMFAYVQAVCARSTKSASDIHVTLIACLHVVSVIAAVRR
jgi:hypothetical protein